MRRDVAIGVCVLLAACGQEAEPQAPAVPAPPPPALQPFIPVLGTMIAAMPKPDAAAQRELKEIGDLALQLVEADARTMGRAERSLLEHPLAYAVLEPALLHEQAVTRRRAAWLCGQSGQTVLQLPLLLRLKYESDPEAVLWVADALHRLGNDAGLAWLDAAMNHETTAQQAGTITVELCRERGVPLSEEPTYVELQGKLRELAARWRREGKGAKADVPPPAQPQLDARLATHLATTQDTPLRPVDDARFVLTRAGVLAVPLLTRTLAASEPYLRTMALQVLAELGPPARPAAAAAMTLLGDPLTATYAMKALGEMGATEAVAALRARLGDVDSELRTVAAQALGLLRDAASAPALTARLQDPNESLDVRVSAAFGLLCLGPNPAAEAFLAEREAKKDYHEPTLARLRERLQK